MATTICAHSSKWNPDNIVDVEQLKTLGTCESLGKLHTPCKHYELLDEFHNRAKELGITVSGEKGRLTNDGRTYFYLCDLNANDNADYALSTGFISDNSKKMSFQTLLSSNCFICENMVVHGVLGNKVRHTINNVNNGIVKNKIMGIFDAYLEKKGDILGQIECMQNTDYSDRLLGDFILSLTREGSIGNKHLLDIVRECDNPTRNKKDCHNATRIWNAASFVAQSIKNPIQRANATRLCNDTIMRLIRPDFTPIGAMTIDAEVIEDVPTVPSVDVVVQ